MYFLNLEDYDREVYEKELKDFLPDEFIDFHVHVFKSGYAPFGNQKVRASTQKSWVGLIGKDVYLDEMTAEQLNDTLTRLFPDKKVTPMIFGCTGKNLDETNGYIKEVGDKYNYPMLYRTDYAMTSEELEDAIIKGGYLGIKPYLQNRPLYIPAAETRIFDYVPHHHLEVLNKHGWILMLHIPRAKRFRDEVNLAQLREIEERYPNVKLIIAHIGRAYAKEDIGNAFEVVGQGENTYFDFTANLCDDAIKACIEAVGTKKLIYGTDLPYSVMRLYRIVDNGVYYNVVRRGDYGDMTNVANVRETDEKNVTLMIYEQIRAFRRVALDMKLSDSAIEDVMRNNAQRLINDVK
ncbi:MAG: amidohydrolase family protein [Clostridia bacterium]|nr:amidohydrolase family protein [Clostridia bacterium]